MGGWGGREVLILADRGGQKAAKRRDLMVSTNGRETPLDADWIWMSRLDRPIRLGALQNAGD